MFRITKWHALSTIISTFKFYWDKSFNSTRLHLGHYSRLCLHRLMVQGMSLLWEFAEVTFSKLKNKEKKN